MRGNAQSTTGKGKAFYTKPPAVPTRIRERMAALEHHDG